MCISEGGGVEVMAVWMWMREHLGEVGFLVPWMGRRRARSCWEPPIIQNQWFFYILPIDEHQQNTLILLRLPSAF